MAQLDQRMSIEAGGDDFLAKPVDAQELFNALATHLQLTWNYEEVVVIPVVDAKAEVIAPEPADLHILLELAQDGLRRELTQAAEEIGQRDDRYRPFIQQMIQLAKEFQLEKIEELIEHHLTNT